MSLTASSLRRLPLLLGLLVAIAAGCKEATPPKEEEEHPPSPVQAEPARKVALGEWTDLLGTTQPLPNHSARISATLEGHVLSVPGDGKGGTVVEGQQVESGAVIVRLDDSVPRANRARLQATLDELKEQQKQAGFALELAQIDVKRLKELLKGGSAGGALPLVSQIELEKAQVMEKDMRSKLASVEKKQAAARADLKALDEQLKFYTLRAPISGRLGIVQAVPGQTLNPGAIVADVVDLEEIDVLCYAPPAAAARLKLGQPAKLVAEEAPGATTDKPLLGKVAFIDAQAQPETGNVAVKVRFPNPGLRLRAQAVVRVYVLTRPEKERLTIPVSALIEDLDVPTVLAIKDLKTEKKDDEEHKLGTAWKLQVVVGVRDREHGLVEILELKDPESKTRKSVPAKDLLFVTAGGNGLHTDDPVELKKEEKEEKEEN